MVISNQVYFIPALSLKAMQDSTAERCIIWNSAKFGREEVSLGKFLAIGPSLFQPTTKIAAVFQNGHQKLIEFFNLEIWISIVWRSCYYLHKKCAKPWQTQQVWEGGWYRILGYFQVMEPHKGIERWSKFSKDIGSKSSKACDHDADNDAVHHARAANIVRR